MTKGLRPSVGGDQWGLPTQALPSCHSLITLGLRMVIVVGQGLTGAMGRSVPPVHYVSWSYLFAATIMVAFVIVPITYMFLR
jgi:hypothetical protein